MRIAEILDYDEGTPRYFPDPLMRWISNAFTRHGSVKRPLDFNAGGASTNLAPRGLESEAGSPIPTASERFDYDGANGPTRGGRFNRRCR